jgi:hypothetical protein
MVVSRRGGHRVGSLFRTAGARLPAADFADPAITRRRRQRLALDARRRVTPVVRGQRMADIPNRARNQARVASRYWPEFLCNAMACPASGRT